jgi:Zn-finger nucleic acid-binding protein
MQCPRCHAHLLEHDRDGVTIDVCSACRGVWLDRGELEKVIAKTARAYHDLARDYGRTSDRPDPPEQRGEDRPRKRNFLESFGDLFD